MTPSLKTEKGVSSCGGREVWRMSGRFCGYLTSDRSPFSNGSVMVSSANAPGTPIKPDIPTRPAAWRKRRRLTGSGKDLDPSESWDAGNEKKRENAKFPTVCNQAPAVKK